jgi:NOL1/NOP2/fmu family ribosome biogenesis protein
MSKQELHDIAYEQAVKDMKFRQLGLKLEAMDNEHLNNDIRAVYVVDFKAKELIIKLNNEKE